MLQLRIGERWRRIVVAGVALAMLTWAAVALSGSVSERLEAVDRGVPTQSSFAPAIDPPGSSADSVVADAWEAAMSISGVAAQRAGNDDPLDDPEWSGLQRTDRRFLQGFFGGNRKSDSAGLFRNRLLNPGDRYIPKAERVALCLAVEIARWKLWQLLDDASQSMLREAKSESFAFSRSYSKGELQPGDRSRLLALERSLKAVMPRMQQALAVARASQAAGTKTSGTTVSGTKDHSDVITRAALRNLAGQNGLLVTRATPEGFIVAPLAMTETYTKVVPGLRELARAFGGEVIGWFAGRVGLGTSEKTVLIECLVTTTSKILQPGTGTTGG